MSSEIDLNVYLKILRKWFWLIGTVVAAAAAASYFATNLMPRTYETAVTLMVGEETANARVSLEDISISQRVAAIYAGMVKRQPIMEATVDALGLDIHWRELQTHVLPIRREGSQVLEIRVADTDPHRAKAIAEEIARQLIEQSPTAQNQKQVEQRREFVKRQLDTLQADIQRAEAAMAEKQDTLAKQVSARGVLDLQDEIKALDLKLSSWRTTYASLLGFVEGKSPNTLSVIEPAYVPSWPVGPNVRANVLMAAAAAGLLALAAVLLIEYRLGHDRLVGPEDVSRELGLPTLGSIALFGGKRKRQDAPIAAREPHSLAAEAYRFVRTNIRFACRGQGSVVLLVASPGIGEGKTTTVANLGVSFAQAGKRTVLVDADLRHPSLHAWFGLANDRGLSTLLSTRAPVLGERVKGEARVQTARGNRDSYLLATSVPGLSILPAGPVPTISPAELVASPAMGEILRNLRNAADVVILDSAPILPVADAVVLAAMDTRVLVVVEAGKTTGRAVREAGEIMRRAEATLLGVVLNKAAKSDTPYYHYTLAGDSRETTPLVLNTASSG